MDYEGAVLDLDGTVYRGDRLLPGAGAAVERLRAAGVRTLFFSNNPTKSRAEYVERLDSLGIEARPEEVLSAGTVTTRFLADEHADDAVFLIGSPGLKRQFETAGLDFVADATDADVLVVSYAREFGYGDMLAGYRALEAGARFYGTDPDMLIPADGGMIPGSGAVINAVGGVLGREPDRIIGKPSTEARRAALDALDVPAERCFVAGDRLDTDIALGERAGMTTVLVRTGVTTDADLETSDVSPDHVVDSLEDLPSALPE
ncbi:HAD-IIA family hydrolase [Natronomonas marina]|uniref:HAD-IIA family hydrolase n=1 Tax=Natronomonas marina TaxID=2961939 RepID=UPI0020C9E61F|nr:HAD-IIA family hydrolase [Natronomonas marina]